MSKMLFVAKAIAAGSLVVLAGCSSLNMGGASDLLGKSKDAITCSGMGSAVAAQVSGSVGLSSDMTELAGVGVDAAAAASGMSNEVNEAKSLTKSGCGGDSGVIGSVSKAAASLW